MIGEIFDLLAEWGKLDTWIVITGALASMACSLPGCFLLLRRQSMMGDALTHTSLLGITAGLMFSVWLKNQGWLTSVQATAMGHGLLLGGAIVIGILAAVLTELIQKLGRVEASAALGVVFTVMFAAGLLLVRLVADDAHIDADCVLYGSVETAFVGESIPAPAVVNGIVLVANLGLTILFYKELRISAFDAAFATSVGVPSRLFHYGLMSVTAATAVAAFESVGTILVIAMLIVPAATAHLLTDRLWVMIGLSLLVAIASAVGGHAAAIALPQPIGARIGLAEVESVSTAGMMAVVSGCIFVLAALCGPRHGVIAKLLTQSALSLRVASEDILGRLYRIHEGTAHAATNTLSHAEPANWFTWFAVRWLHLSGELRYGSEGLELTDKGRVRAVQLVRSHRLFESYVAKHFPLDDDHLHEVAERVEHYINSDMRREMADELEDHSQDPHGRVIPEEEG